MSKNLRRPPKNAYPPSPNISLLVSSSSRSLFYFDGRSRNRQLHFESRCVHETSSPCLKRRSNNLASQRKIRDFIKATLVPSSPSQFTNSSAYHNFTVREFSTQSTNSVDTSRTSASNNPGKCIEDKNLSNLIQDGGIQVLTSPKKDVEKKQMEQLTERLLNTNTDDIESKLLSLNIMECTKAIIWWCSYSSNNINRLKSSYEAMEQAEALYNKLIQHQLSNPSIQILTLEHAHTVLDGWRRYALLQGKATTSIHNDTKGTKLTSLQSISQRCDSLLSNLETLAERNEATFIHPDHKMYNLVMNTHAKIGNYEAAETLIERMKKKSSSSSSYPRNCRPDTTSYNTLLSAYANHESVVNDADAPYKAEALLQEMFVLSEFNHEIQPNSISFATVLSAWSNHAHILGTVAATRAESILDHMHEISLSSNDSFLTNNIVPDIICYTAVMNAWAKSGDPQSTKKIRSLLEKIHENDESFNFEADDKIPVPVVNESESTNFLEDMMIPNTTTFTTLIDAYARSLSEDAGEAAEAVLRHMQESSHKSNNTDINIQPNTITYNAVMNAHSKSRQWDSGLKAQALLDEMLNNQSLSTQPDVRSYATLIDAWANSSHPKRGEEAEKVLFCLLDSIHDHDGEGSVGKIDQGPNHALLDSPNRNVMIFPNDVCFTSAINAWATLGNPKRAERILDKMINFTAIAKPGFGETNNGGKESKTYICTNATLVTAWNAVLKAHAKVGEAREAQKLLDKMKTYDLVPDEISYTTVIDAWARQSSSNKEAPGKCEDILKQMTKNKLNPSNVAYNTVLNAFAKSQREDSVKKSLSILEEMEKLYMETKDLNTKPNSVSFNTVISALAGSGDAHTAEELLYRMQEIYMNEKNEITNQKQIVKPDIFSYTSVISAWSKSDIPDAAERAESILNHMKELSSEIPELTPNTVTFSSVLFAWARRGDAKRCQNIINHMEELNAAGNKDISLNSVVYNTLINCWAKVGSEKGAREAENVLLKMQDRYDRNDCTFGPDTISYNSVLSAFQRSSIPNISDKAEKLVQTMEEIFDKNQRKTNKYNNGEAPKEPQKIEPDNVTYTSLIQCLAKSQNPHKARKANSILLKQENIHNSNKNKALAPNIFMYDAVIRSCAFSNTNNEEVRKEATRIAIETFMKMRDKSSKGSQNVRINSFVYTTFIMALSNLTKGKQFSVLIEKTIDHCCEDGVLDNAVLKCLQKNNISREILRKLVSSKISSGTVQLEKLTVNDLPQQWSRHSKKSIARKISSRQKKRQKFDGGRKRI